MSSWRWLSQTIVGIVMAIMVTLVVMSAIATTYMAFNSEQLEYFNNNRELATSGEIKVIVAVGDLTNLISIPIMLLIVGLLLVMVYNSLPFTLKIMYRTLILIMLAGALVALDISITGDAVVMTRLKSVLNGEQLSKVIGIRQIDICYVIYAVANLVVALSIRIRAMRMYGRYR